MGFLLAVAAVLCNVGFFISLPGQPAIVWVSVVLAAVALFFIVWGLVRTFGRSGISGGRILSSLVATVALVLVGLALFSFYSARAIPATEGAPAVGQKAPDFTLVDTAGQRVSLSQLLAAPAGSGPTKAVLLVFYRGYW